MISGFATKRYERPRSLPAPAEAVEEQPELDPLTEPSRDTADASCAQMLASLAREITLPPEDLAVYRRIYLAGWTGCSRAARRRGLKAMPRDVTPRQLDVLRVFARLAAKEDRNPRVLDIADALSISKAAVHEHIDALVRKRCLRRDTRRTRGVTLAVLVPLGAEDLK